MSPNAWLTPDNLPAGLIRRALFIRGDQQWVEHIYGALMLLTESENWEKYGALTPEDVVKPFIDTMDDLLYHRGYVLDTGEVFFSARSDTPFGCLPCDGSQVIQADYPALYAVIGTSFGAAAAGYFRIPDLRDRIVVGTGSTFALADTGGSATHTLSVGELPAHDHNQPVHTHYVAPHSHGILTSLPVLAAPGAIPVEVPAAVPNSTAADAGQNTGSAGGDQTGQTGSGDPVDIRNPYLALKAWIVAT